MEGLLHAPGKIGIAGEPETALDNCQCGRPGRPSGESRLMKGEVSGGCQRITERHSDVARPIARPIRPTRGSVRPVIRGVQMRSKKTMNRSRDVTAYMNRGKDLLCKCCGHRTELFAKINANRSCGDENETIFPPSADWISYFRCRSCGFLFTNYFDTFSNSDMAKHIYNADYVLADPDFIEKRPKSLSACIGDMLRPMQSCIDALDYGGGKGLFARLMRDQNFSFDSADSYFGDTLPAKHQYDLVTALEVIEHSRDPQNTIHDILAYLKPRGVVLFSTVLQPRIVTEDWWYIGPRNGHVSLFSERSLRSLSYRCGVKFISINDWIHLMYFGRRSDIAKSILRAWRPRSILYHASRRGLLPLAHVTGQLGALGFLEATNPRHLARAVFTAVKRTQRTGGW